MLSVIGIRVLRPRIYLELVTRHSIDYKVEKLNDKAHSRISQGFQPGPGIQIVRFLARAIAGALRLHGRTRWSNEFIQALDPAITVNVRANANETCNIWFRTGHGRLLWRVRDTPHEEPEVNEWIGTFGPEDVFLDIGANIGLYSLLAAKLKCCQVLAVEADLMNSRLLYENVVKNGVSDKVTVIPVALSSRSHQGRLHLKSLSYGDALHNLDSPSNYVSRPCGEIVSILAFSFHQLAEMLNLPNPTKVKIDVDGHELEILRGFGKRLSCVDEVIVEVDPSRFSCQQIHKFLEESGFHLIFEASPRVPWNSTRNRVYARELRELKYLEHQVDMD